MAGTELCTICMKQGDPVLFPCDRGDCPIPGKSKDWSAFFAHSGAPVDCFWERCSNSKRCAAFGSCVAKAQAGGATFPTKRARQVWPDIPTLVRELRAEGSDLCHQAAETIEDLL